MSRSNHRALGKLERLSPEGTIKVAYIEGDGAYIDVKITLANLAKSIQHQLNLIYL